MTLRTMLGASCLLVAACAGAASPSPAASRLDCAGLTRGNWVLEWSDYVERETTFDGKPMKVFGAAPGARRLVRDADVTAAKAGIGGAMFAAVGEPAGIFDAAKIQLSAGEIDEREVPGDRLAAVCVSGEHAHVYWTKPHRKTRVEERRTIHEAFSTLYIEGVSAGETTLTLRLPDGTTQTTLVVVTEASRRPTE